MAGIFQNSKTKEGENSISENAVHWFLRVSFSNSHSKANKQGVGIHREQVLSNNSVVAPRWEIETGDTQTIFPSFSQVSPNQYRQHLPAQKSEYEHCFFSHRGILRTPQEALPLVSKPGTSQENTHEKLIFAKVQTSPTLAGSIPVGPDLIKEHSAEREVGDQVVIGDRVLKR